MSRGGGVDHNEFNQSLPFNLKAKETLAVSGTSGEQRQAYSVHSFVPAPSCARHIARAQLMTLNSRLFIQIIKQ